MCCKTLQPREHPARQHGRNAALAKSTAKKTNKRAGTRAGRTSTARAPARTTTKKRSPAAGKSASAGKSSRSALTRKPPAKRASSRPAPGVRKAPASIPAGLAEPKRNRKPRLEPVVAPPPPRPGDAKPLTLADVEEFRHMLLAKRAEILGDVSTLQGEALHANRQEAAGDLSSMPIHMADLGSDNYELEFTLGLIEGERAILKEIDEAIERIRTGTYGQCLATGAPIGKSRLRAKPWAKYCYEYTLAQERGQG